ncbi:SPOR domain-containing protein [Legionella saoudiensis]|uniref:SPOR domain-containing protein n=1 Tax=Legionella saoudiensis TaxID=1750561 RepID=UPI0007303B79|nr:SPOR domain-containing protein [Legionella saoudiensis]
MKLVMDEKLKHRLVGISVVLSLGAIFLPAMMKKSSQRLENSLSVNVQLPPKPIAPNVAVTDEEQMFKTIKIAKVNIKSAVSQKTVKEDFIASAPVHEKPSIPVAKIEPAPAVIEKPIELALNNAAQASVHKEIKVVQAKIEKNTVRSIEPVAKPAAPIAKPVQVAAQQVIKPKPEVVKPKIQTKPVVAQAVVRKPTVKRDIYALQLASFSKLGNAEALVRKLQGKGYKASYTRVAGRNGTIYKVYVGHSPIRDNVVKLKTQLASAMQLNGFVVNTGVS